MSWTRRALSPIRRCFRAFLRVSHVLMRVLAVVALAWFATAARSSMDTPPPFPPDAAHGRMIVLPGIHNTLFHLNGFFDMARVALPNFEIDRRKWGLTFFGIRNLRAAENNEAFARALADEIAQWRRQNPDRLLYLLGYSGGGGVASLVLEQLPEGVSIDRVILIAPAISADFPIDRHAREHVAEFVVNFASVKDLQVGLGTKLFGTIDRKYEYAAGFDGFSVSSEQLAQWHWSTADHQIGHYGNHVAYLGRRWQREYLLPALDPSVSRARLEQYWHERRGSTVSQ